MKASNWHHHQSTGTYSAIDSDSSIQNCSSVLVGDRRRVRPATRNVNSSRALNRNPFVESNWFAHSGLYELERQLISNSYSTKNSWSLNTSWHQQIIKSCLRIYMNISAEYHNCVITSQCNSYMTSMVMYSFHKPGMYSHAHYGNTNSNNNPPKLTLATDPKGSPSSIRHIQWYEIENNI